MNYCRFNQSNAGPAHGPRAGHVSANTPAARRPRSGPGDRTAYAPDARASLMYEQIIDPIDSWIADAKLEV